MTVTVSLRANQTVPLTWAQTDSNFSVLAAGINAVGNSISPQGGTTGQRPTLATTPSVVLWQQYFDTTINQQITCVQTLPSIVWKNAAGAIV